MEQLGLRVGDGLALAVSGGPDSMALAVLAAEWNAARGRRAGPLVAAVVDHGLREGSDEEAAKTARWLKALGVRAVVRRLEWSERPPEALLQTAARNRRYAALAGVCKEHGIRALAVAHHLQDNVETMLMRFARSSGLRGLAGMGDAYYYNGAVEEKGFVGDGGGGGGGASAAAAAAASAQRGCPVTDLGHAAESLAVVRPFLRVRKEALLATCQARGVEWVTDPSNVHLGFDRVRVREALARMCAQPGERPAADAAADASALAPLAPPPASPEGGQKLELAHFAQALESLRETRGVMESYVESSLQRCSVWVKPFGMCYLNVHRLLQEDPPIQVAILLGVFQRLGQPYLSHPSTHSLQSLLAQLRAGSLPAPLCYGVLRVVEEGPADGRGRPRRLHPSDPSRMLRIYRAVFEDNKRDPANDAVPLAAQPGKKDKKARRVREASWDGRFEVRVVERPGDRKNGFGPAPPEELRVRPLRMSDRTDLFHRAQRAVRRGVWRKPELFPWPARGGVRSPHGAMRRVRALLPAFAYDAGLPAVVDASDTVVALPHFPALALDQGGSKQPRYVIASAKCHLSSPPSSVLSHASRRPLRE